MHLIRTLILRPLRRDLLRTALTVLSVALGVAVVVAIDLAGDAATGSFRSSMQTLVGKTDLEIHANGGIDEAWIARLAALPFDIRCAPMLETQATIPGVGSVPLYGVDSVSNAERTATPPSGSSETGETVLASNALARRLPPGEFTATIEGRTHTLHVASPIEAGTAEFLVLDIADFQHLLGRYGKLDRIDIFIQPGEDPAQAERAIRNLLPHGYLVERPGSRSEENQRMLRAFRWNLKVLSYISLVVGAFLIYNTISISVVRRRAEIGILRAVGASRSTVLALFLGEALLFGICGAALGLLVGRLLAAGMVGLISSTVNALYATSRPTAVELTAGEAWVGFLTGCTVALLSAFAPAREAMDVSPSEALSRGAHEHQARLRWRYRLAWSVVLALLAGLASQAGPWQGYPIGGYLSALLAIAAIGMASPAAVLGMHAVLRSLLRRRVEMMLAGRSLSALSRTSVVVGALATAIAMMASVGIMVGSFRETVALWLDTQLRADLYVRVAGDATAGVHPALPASVLPLLAATPGVAAVDDFHALEFHYHDERATLGAGNMEIVRRYGRMRFLPGQDRDRILRSLPGHDTAIVSEPFANKHGVHAGDRLVLPLGERELTVTVAGVYYEYSSSQGYVILDRSTLLHYMPEQPATNAAVYLLPGADAERVRRELQAQTAGLGIAIAPNQLLRSTSMAIFDRTFAVTWALEAVAIVVAMLGAANSLLALVLDRRRELGLLRYLGASASQIRVMILSEAGVLGLFSAVLGLLLGLVLSLLLVFVVNKQSFGWTIQFHIPGQLLAGALLLVWGVTVLAGLYPARVASRLEPIDVIHEE